ncbi:MAG: hypothetical protein IKQ91_04645 [Oscillospiraceae bacterium]|nr:hypothetical protein [Oscillospiraceae bacterium]
MSDFANALADLLTKMDQKIDALGEQQKAMDAKLERYSAFLVKKMNETADSVANVQTAQAKLVTESLDKMGHQVDIMERQIAGRLSPDEQNTAVLQKLDQTADKLQHTVERSINLVGYHGNTIEQSLTAASERLAAQIEESVKQQEAHADAFSKRFEQFCARIDCGADAPIEKPEAVPENPEAVPENPEAFPENPEAGIFEAPDAPVENPAAPIENPQAPVENPEPVIETGGEVPRI